jgi:SAM-dependent methyltransferase
MKQREQALDTHFKFGENWERLLPQIDEQRVAFATRDIAKFMERKSLEGLTFLDIGCGSGLSSLAAYRLGAKSIVSIDIDPANIANTEHLKRKFSVSEDFPWQSYTASIVGRESGNLPPSDVVYAWGVLHHTGAMWDAIDNCARLVKPGGFLYLMIYRDAWCAGLWRLIKRTYTRGGPAIQWVIRNGFAAILIAGLLSKGKNPRRIMHDYAAKRRGMSWYVDVTDWVGGYPFEYTNAEQVINRLDQMGLRLKKLCPPISRKPIGWRGGTSYQYLFHRA